MDKKEDGPYSRLYVRIWKKEYGGYTVDGYPFRPDGRAFQEEMTIGYAMRMWMLHGWETEILEYSPDGYKSMDRYDYWRRVYGEGFGG